MEGKFDIIETAIQAREFSTLITALEAAGLLETFKGGGPFTVFAPTDAAFAKVPQETLSELLNPENKNKLTSILTYHVVPGKFMARSLMEVNKAPTVQGQAITIEALFGIKIDGATVTSADIEATNGVIHAIDAVLMPSTAVAA